MTSDQTKVPPPVDEPFDYIEQARAIYGRLGFEPYRWTVNHSPIPLAKLPKPLSECRLALIATGGIYRRGQVAFSFKDDTSYRRIPVDIDPNELRVTHFGYDLTDARRDPNVVLPLQALNHLVADGFLGSLATYALTFIGAIYSQRRVRDELIPGLVREVRDLDADIALLVPVCPVCHQSVGLIARRLEDTGVPTVSMSTSWSVTESVKPPRSVFLDFPLGHTAGPADQPDEQLLIMRQTLELFDSATESGRIIALDHHWPVDWKSAESKVQYDAPHRPPSPQYQCEDDKQIAIERYGAALALEANNFDRIPIL